MVVTKETNLGEILDADPTTAIYFMQIGMHCLGCPASRGENLEQACWVHGVDVDDLLNSLTHSFCRLICERYKLRQPFVNGCLFC